MNADPFFVGSVVAAIVGAVVLIAAVVENLGKPIEDDGYAFTFTAGFAGTVVMLSGIVFAAWRHDETSRPMPTAISASTSATTTTTTVIHALGRGR
jgi:hypothetical protein